MVWLTLIVACVFALVHTGIGALKFLNRTPRSRWLSASGGVAVAYVFLHILPELATHGNTFVEALKTSKETGEAIVYMLGLIGLVVFYGLERSIKRSRGRDRARAPDVSVFWLHIGSFAIYNMIVGYLLLHRESHGTWSLAIYGFAMTLHFVSTDYGLREDHSIRYDSVARWILAASVLAGWGLGVVAQLSQLWIAFLFAFLAGGVILNVLKEELPEERESDFWPFLGAALVYAAILLAV
tara:strand:+ start:7111 stop:7830 length:720 start_codon:yes stop_codon:yes gene_type:complete